MYSIILNNVRNIFVKSLVSIIISRSAKSHDLFILCPLRFCEKLFQHQKHVFRRKILLYLVFRDGSQY